MPSDYFYAIFENTKTLYLSGIFFILCIGFVVLYFSVLKPKKGTIEWIHTYATDKFEPFIYEPLTIKDGLCWILTFAVAFGLGSLRFFVHYRLGLMEPFSTDVWQMIRTGAEAAFALSVVFFVFFRLFYTSRYVAFLLTCISCALLSREMYAVILLLGSWIFLFLWICNNYRNYKRIHSLYLALALVLYCLTLMACWASVFLAGIFLSGLVMGKVMQWHRGDQEKKKGRFIVTFILGCITCGIIVLVMWLFYYAHTNENMSLLTAALSGGTYHDIIPVFIMKMGDITLPEKPVGNIIRQDIFRPILFITSLIPTVYSGIFKKKTQALTATICAVSFLSAWIISGVDIMCSGAMLSIGWMFKGFSDRGHKGYAALISVAVLGFYFLSLFIT